jgi:hypothetical protein
MGVAPPSTHPPDVADVPWPICGPTPSASRRLPAGIGGQRRCPPQRWSSCTTPGAGTPDPPSARACSPGRRPRSGPAAQRGRSAGRAPGSRRAAAHAVVRSLGFPLPTPTPTCSATSCSTAHSCATCASAPAGARRSCAAGHLHRDGNGGRNGRSGTEWTVVHQQTKPPSTIRSTPVQKLAASLSRKTAGPTSSSTVAIRPSGVSASNCLTCSATSGLRFIGVAV